MILSKDPDAKIIIVSAAAPFAEQANTGAIKILSKPVDLDKLYGALYDAGSAGRKPPPNEKAGETGSEE
jgi:ActR/RegA family two-component response regulator